jgi:hypothetical protein
MGDLILPPHYFARGVNSTGVFVGSQRGVQMLFKALGLRAVKRPRYAQNGRFRPNMEYVSRDFTTA